MKLNFTRTLALLLVVILSYSACNKTVTKPAAKVDDVAVAKQIALSLYQSLTGKLGGTNINDGLKAPSSITPGKNTRKLNTLSLCGFVIDSAYSKFDIVADTSKWMSGKFHYLFNCDANSKVNGYTVYDSLKLENKSSTDLEEYTNIQQYTFKAVDSASSDLDGSIRTSTSKLSYSTPGVQSAFYSMDCNYTLKSLLIVNTKTNADITKGIATFVSETEAVNGPSGAPATIIHYTGYIEYLGNHTGKLYIDNYGTYMVDFIAVTITKL